MTRKDKAYSFIDKEYGILDKVMVRIPGSKLRKISKTQKDIANHSKSKASVVDALVYGRKVDGRDLSQEDRQKLAAIFSSHRRDRLKKISELKSNKEDLISRANKARNNKYLNEDNWHKNRSISTLKSVGAYEHRPK